MLSDSMMNGAVKRPAMIHLSTIINQDGNLSRYNFAMRGQLFRMGDIVYLRFLEDDKGNGHPIPMTIRINMNGHVKITRSLPGHAMQLSFVQGKRVRARYQTPYGAIPITTLTPNVDLQYKNQPFSGNLRVDYDLYSEAQLLGHYRLRLQFTV